MNSFESQFGGGYIFRYTFTGKISQIGIEDIRAVSVFDGGTWTTNQFDENRAWTFVVFNRVQNAWVRNTTTYRFVFGNTNILNLAKWVGAHPDYAEDGYWISHGTPVESDSLYLKQLEDRLAPEGTGGAISTVSFTGDSSPELLPGETSQFTLSRAGNSDGMVAVQFLVAGEWKTITVADRTPFSAADRRFMRLRIAFRDQLKMASVSARKSAGFLEIGHGVTDECDLFESDPFHVFYSLPGIIRCNDHAARC